MSVRSIVVVILALICGASAAVLVSQLHHSADSQEVAKPDTIAVVVAARDIPRGRTLTPEDLRTNDWPKESVPEGALTTTDEALERAAMNQIFSGEPILNAKLAAKGMGRAFAALIPKGMRAYVISAARATQSVAGFVQPDDTVDVLLNLRGQGQNDETGGGSTTLLLQGIKVWAVEQRLDVTSDGKTNYKEISAITLLVTPDDANKLDLGQTQGQLSLTLRNPEDKEPARTEVVTVNDIRGYQGKPREVPKPEAEKPAVESAAPAVDVPEEPRAAQIVTLRGDQRGMVVVEMKKH